MDKKSFQFDPDFPNPINIGPNSIRWIEQEINEYVQKKINASRHPEF